MSFAQVPMQFEPVELHVVDAFGQQDVPEYFQQFAKAITEDVSVMSGPQAQAWIQAILAEIASFKKLGVYEEIPREHATTKKDQEQVKDFEVSGLTGNARARN